jgi:hypothetical protein
MVDRPLQYDLIELLLVGTDDGSVASDGRAPCALPRSIRPEVTSRIEGWLSLNRRKI